MQYAVETFQLTKEFPQNKQLKDLLFSPFSKNKIIAIDNISMSVYPGEIFCLLGPNGAGKTTIMKVLCTLIWPSCGQALVNNYDVVREPQKVRQSIGYVISDERSFYWRLTVYQNLKFFAVLSNIPGSEIKARLGYVLKLLDLEDKISLMFKDLSLGMKQKLAIARGLLTDPPILFMDEPTRSLDPDSAGSLRRFIAEDMVAKKGKTVFLTTHNLKEASEIGHRMAIINRGRITACGTLAELTKGVSRLSRYLIRVQRRPADWCEKLRANWPGKIEIKMTKEEVEPGMDEIEMTVNQEDGVAISQVIAYLLTSGINIEGWARKEIPIDEIYSRYVASCPDVRE